MGLTSKQEAELAESYAAERARDLEISNKIKDLAAQMYANNKYDTLDKCLEESENVINKLYGIQKRPNYKEQPHELIVNENGNIMCYSHLKPDDDNFIKSMLYRTRNTNNT